MIARRLTLALSAVLGLTLLPLPGPPGATAQAAPNDVIAVVLDGVGNGHGRGMSQWGAYGWAVDRGWNWPQILDHYYGGTTSGTVSADRRIRVRLLALDGADTVGIVSHGAGVTWGTRTRASMKATRNTAGGYDIWGSTSVSCPDPTSLVVPDGPLAKGATGDAVRQIQQFLTVFGFDPGGVDGDFGNLTETAVLRFQTDRSLTQDGRWDLDDATAARAMIADSSSSAVFTLLGTSTTPPRFTTAPGEGPTTALGLCRPNGSVTHYRGALEVWNVRGSTRVVNDVAVEDYLRGVVPKEISASWAQAGSGRGAEAVRAQAVAARSYGLQQNRYVSDGAYASTCDSQACQVYGGSATRTIAGGTPTLVEDFRTDQAIAATARVVRFWAGTTNIVSTEFSASNGPRTAGGAFPPRDDVPGDSTPRNPNHRWTRVLDADTLAERYGLDSLVSATMVEARSSSYRRFDGIWFNDIVLTGSNGRTVQMNAWDFRRDQRLLSPGFTVRVVTRDSIGADVAFIGDSVGNSIAGTANSEFRTLTDGTFDALTIDVLDGRFITRTPPTPSGVQAAARMPMDLDLAIVELGYNPSTNMAADIDAMMNALTQRRTKRVIWVNMAEIRTKADGSSFYASANAALTAATARWPNLAVANWNQTSAAAGLERTRWFTDGVHLSATGQAQFALWLRQVAGTSGAGTPSTGGGTGSATGGGASSQRFAANQRIELPVVGQQVVGADGARRTVPTGISAVAVNITAVNPSEAGYVTVWPCDVARPEASNLNFSAGSIVANGVIAPVGARGTVCFYSNQATDFLVDIAGWFSGGTGGTPPFVGATPKRVLDTRNAIGAPRVRVAAGGVITLPISGVSMRRSDGSPVAIPVDATAVAMNITAVGPSRGGYFTVWPCGAPRPEASNVNFAAGSIVANGVVSSLGANGSICLYSNQESDVLVDVLGWFSAGSGTPPYVGSVPLRLVDTRNGVGGPRSAITPGAPKSVPIRGVTVVVNGVRRQVPADATAVALNVTMTEAQGDGFATVWPCGTTRPEASNVNFTEGGTVANGVVAPIGANGAVCVYASATSHVLVDIAGWFTGGTQPAFTGNVPERLVDTRNNIGPAPI